MIPTNPASCRRRESRCAVSPRLRSSGRRSSPDGASCPRDDACPLQRMEAVREAGAFTGRELLAAVRQLLWIHRQTQAAHAVDGGRVVHLAEKLPLLESDAVLAGDRSAKPDAEADDFCSEHLGAIVRARFAAIVEDQRMEVAVAGMKDVGDANAVLPRQRLDGDQRLAKACARNDPILDDEVG